MLEEFEKISHAQKISLFLKEQLAFATIMFIFHILCIKINFIKPTLVYMFVDFPEKN